MQRGATHEAVHKGPDGEIVETAREARQGYLDRPVLAVVAVSTGLAMGALLLLWLVFFAA